MVPGDDPVVNAEQRVRQRQVVVARRRESFEYTPPVVGKVASGAALERRETIDLVTPMRLQQGSDFDEHIAGQIAPLAARRILPFRPRALAADDGDRIGGQERIAPEADTGCGAVQEQSIWQAGQLLAATVRVGSFGELDDRRDGCYPAR